MDPGPIVEHLCGWPKLAFQIKLDTAVRHPLGWPKLAFQKDIGRDVRPPPGWHKLIYQKLCIPKVSLRAVGRQKLPKIAVYVNSFAKFKFLYS